MGQQQIFTINGLVDTNKTVWQNLEELAGASAAYVTWDPYTFKYGVVINQPGTSIRSFTDDNIIGAISITETPFDELYNSAEIRFPNKDIRDKTDTILYAQPPAERFDSEPDNKLSIQFDFVNDPIQADVIARTELKQSRVSKTISFTTDFQQLDMAPGDIIDLTNPYWGWDAKLFRIVEITQTDTVQGEIFVDIVAVEYDADVYNYNDLTRLERTVNTGIPAVKNNAAVQIKSDQDLGTQVGRAVATDQGAAAIRDPLANVGYPVLETLTQSISTAQFKGIYSIPSSFNGAVELLATGKTLEAKVTIPSAIYYISDGAGGRVGGANETTLPVDVDIKYSTDNGATYTSVTNLQHTVGAGAQALTFTVIDPAPGIYLIEFQASSYVDVDYDATFNSDYPLVASRTGDGIATEVNWILCLN